MEIGERVRRQQQQTNKKSIVIYNFNKLEPSMEINVIGGFEGKNYFTELLANLFNYICLGKTIANYQDGRKIFFASANSFAYHFLYSGVCS